MALGELSAGKPTVPFGERRDWDQTRTTTLFLTLLHFLLSRKPNKIDGAKGDTLKPQP